MSGTISEWSWRKRKRRRNFSQSGLLKKESRRAQRMRMMKRRWRPRGKKAGWISSGQVFHWPIAEHPFRVRLAAIVVILGSICVLYFCFHLTLSNLINISMCACRAKFITMNCYFLFAISCNFSIYLLYPWNNINELLTMQQNVFLSTIDCTLILMLHQKANQGSYYMLHICLWVYPGLNSSSE